MKPKVSLRRALTDPQLLGSMLGGDTWFPWRVLLIAAMGEPLISNEERAVFTKLTGRDKEPGKRVEELWAIVGRRGGKSRAISVLATYTSGLCDHSDVLVGGERGVLLCVAPDQRQAGIVLEYCEAAFQSSPILRKLIASNNSDSITLTNGITINVRAANFRRLRGPTYIGVIADEAAFWMDDSSSANPDTAILNAVRPGLSTTGGLLATITSPYARRGEVFETYRRNFGPTGDPLILVAQGASRDLNSTLPQRVVDRALERDPASASAEYMAQFRSDIESFISREAVLACVESGIRERPRMAGARYRAFVDPSGASVDSFTIAISHREKEIAVLDALRERKPPFSPQQVVEEYAELLKSYGITTVVGDRYAGEWPREQFRKCGITYEPATKPKSDLYRDLLPLINSGTVSLLDNERLISQIVGLERRTARGGRDSIDHAPNSRDDLGNAVAGAIYLAGEKTGYDRTMRWVRGDVPAFDDDKTWRARSYFSQHVKTGGW